MPFYSPDRSLPQPYRHFPGGPGQLVPAPYEYARHFDGVDDVVMVTATQVTALAGATDFTWAILMRLDPVWVASGVATVSMTNMTSAGGSTGYMAVNSISFSETATCNFGGFAANGTTPIKPEWGWFILVLTKPAGTATPRFHMYHPGHPSANAAGWIHENGSGTVGNMATFNGGTTRFGQWILSQCYAFDIAVAAQWLGEMSDGQVEALSANRATADWYFHSMANPAGLWEFNQTNPFINGYDPVDQTGGGANATSITGTEAIGAGPYPWTYMSAPDQPFPTINRPDLNQQPLVPA